MTSAPSHATGHTPRAFVLVLAVILALPLVVQLVVEARAGAGIHVLDVFRRVPTAAGLRTFEKRLGDDLVVAKRVRPPYAELLDRAFGRGNGKVVTGKNGWLYYNEDLTFLAAPGLRELHTTDAHHTEVRANDPFDAILDYARQLDAAGVTLVLVAIPEKATIVPEHLAPRMLPNAAPNNRDLVTALESLAARGVFVIELTAPLLEAKAAGIPVFLPLDTHWSPQGAQYAAAYVGARIRALPAFRGLAKERTVFDHRLVEFERRGDLYRLLAYSDRETVYPLQKLLVEQVVALPKGKPPIARESPITVLGDSFTVIYGDPTLDMGHGGGFAEHLADDLGVPLDVIAIPGGGPHRSREAFSLRSEGVSGKRILVWQIAERDLLNKDVTWTHVPLPRATERAPHAEPSRAESKKRVRARLTGVSKLPERLPYGDCLVITSHEPVDGARDLPSPFFVAMWGRRNWQPAEGSAAIAGVVSDLTLVPVRERVDIERTCFADTVGLKGQLYWADEVQRAP